MTKAQALAQTAKMIEMLTEFHPDFPAEGELMAVYESLIELQKTIEKLEND